MSYETKKGSPLAARWRNAVAESDLSSHAKHILKEIHSFMRPDGTRAFPTISLLASRTSLSEKTVSSHLKRAELAGWISIQIGRFEGKRWRQQSYFPRWPDGGGEVGKTGQEGAVNDG